MKRLFLLLHIILLCRVGWTQKPFKKVQQNPTPHGTLQPINVPATGVPLAEQPFSGSTVIRTIPFLQKPGMGLPQGLKIITSDKGLPTMIEGTLPTSSYPLLKTAEERTAQYLNALGKAMQLKKPSEEFVLKSSETDDLGQTHTRMTQQLGKIPVWGGEIIVHEQQGQVKMVNGVYFPTPSVSSLQPSLSHDKAAASVREDLDKKTGFKILPDEAKEQIGGEQVRSELVIFHIKDNRDAERLAWHITAYPNVVHRYEYFVDAENGDILEFYQSSCTFAGHFHLDSEKNEKTVQVEEIEKNVSKKEENLTVDGAFTAQAIDLLGVTRTINTYQVGTRYYMLDGGRPMFKLAASVLPSKPVGAIQTLDYANTDDGPFAYISTTNNAWNNPTAVSAHYNSGRAYDYFRTTFNRNSINARGGTLTSFINVTDERKSMENAYWNGEAMFYGNGSQAFRPLARGLDVAGHEISHGVIQNTANLRYQNEPGALNESFADIFGVMIDRDDWQIGEDVINGRTFFPTGFLRDMANPNNGGTNLNSNGWQPKHVNEKYNGTEDEGGVHINSGITNYAFYLFANNAAVGKTNAEQIYYRALSRYLVASSKFIDCRAAVELACKDLFPTTTAILTAAQNAFTQVGIGGGGSSTGTTYQQDLPVNPGSDYVVYASDDQSKLLLTNGSASVVTTLSTKGVINKPSVSDNGSRIYFIGKNKKMYTISFNWAASPPTFSESEVQPDPVWNNVAVSKDGRKIAGNDGTDTLWIYSFAKTEWRAHKLFNPTSAEGVESGEVQYSDGLEWDHFGESVMYDAFNSIAGQGGAAPIDYWDVGFINVWSNKTNNWVAKPQIQKLFTDLPEDVSIGNATFAKNSPYIIAFDYIDNSESTSKYYILGANTQTGATTQAAAGIYKNNTLGYPSFSRTDNRLLFTNETATGASQLFIVNLASNKLEPNGSPTLFKTDGEFGNWFANGTRTLTALNELDKTAVEISPNPFSDNLTVKISSETATQGKLEVFDLLGRVVKSTSSAISVGKNTVPLETTALEAGAYLLKITVGVQSRTVKIVKF